MNKIITLLAMLLIAQFGFSQIISTEKLPDSSSMKLFRNPIQWMIEASNKDLRTVFNNPEFIRFSVTKDSVHTVYYDFYKEKSISSKKVNEIISAINQLKPALEKYISKEYQVEHTQWANYFETDIIWKPGPVFVFKDYQLIEIWLDLTN